MTPMKSKIQINMSEEAFKRKYTSDPFFRHKMYLKMEKQGKDENMDMADWKTIKMQAPFFAADICGIPTRIGCMKN